MSKKFEKTYGPWKRDLASRGVIPNKWTYPVFDYLKNAQWQFTEKLDGTNMRLIYNPGSYQTVEQGSIEINLPPTLELRGRSDEASVYPKLKSWAARLSPSKFEEVLKSCCFETDQEICIYGEGVGAGIQKGGNDYGETHFRAFAIQSRGVWWEPYFVDRLCRLLNIPQAPVILEASLLEGIEFMKSGFRTCITGEPKGWAEGLVGVPTVPLQCHPLDRLAVKIKSCDFQEAF